MVRTYIEGLTAESLETEAGISRYKQGVSEIEADSPYYSLELLKSHEEPTTFMFLF